MNCMIAAFVTSTHFPRLLSHLSYLSRLCAASRADAIFKNPAWFRPIYLAILFTHLVLAVVIVPMVFITLSRALKATF